MIYKRKILEISKKQCKQAYLKDHQSFKKMNNLPTDYNYFTKDMKKKRSNLIFSVNINEKAHQKSSYLVQGQPQPTQWCPTFHQGGTMQKQHPRLAPIHRLLQSLLLIHHTLQPSTQAKIMIGNQHP